MNIIKIYKLRFTCQSVFHFNLNFIEKVILINKLKNSNLNKYKTLSNSF